MIVVNTLATTVEAVQLSSSQRNVAIGLKLSVQKLNTLYAAGTPPPIYHFSVGDPEVAMRPLIMLHFIARLQIEI